MSTNTQNVHYSNVHCDQPAGLLQMAWEHQKWQKGHTGLVCCPLQYTLFPQTGSSLRVWLETNSMQRLVISVWYGKRAHLFHMPLVLNFESLIGCKKCDTVVSLTTAPGTLGGYQPLNWAWLAGVCKCTHMGLNTTERNYYYHLPKHLLRSQ